jgi:hypothetical protein
VGNLVKSGFRVTSPNVHCTRNSRRQASSFRESGARRPIHAIRFEPLVDVGPRPSHGRYVRARHSGRSRSRLASEGRPAATRGKYVQLPDARIESAIQEVLAVTVLGRRFPELINDNEKVLQSSFVVPTECLGEVEATVRAEGPV